MAGGEFYRHVGGRGRGTILKQPDYSGMFAANAKNLGALAKQKEDAKLKKQAAAKKKLDVISIDNDAWTEDMAGIGSEIDALTKEWAETYQYYEDRGEEMPLDIETKFGTRARELEGLVENSKVNRTQFKQFWMKNEEAKSKGIISDEQYLENQKELTDWRTGYGSKSIFERIAMRSEIPDFDLREKFDYFDYVNKNIVNPASKKALIQAEQSGILGTSKQWLNTTQEKAYTLPQAQADFLSAYRHNKRFSEETLTGFNNWKDSKRNAGDPLEVEYTTYEKSGSKINEVKQTVPVTSPEEYLMYVEAPRTITEQITLRPTPFGSGTSVSVTTTTNPKDAVPPYQMYQYSRNTASADPSVISTVDYPAYADNSNSNFTKPTSTERYSFTKNAITISSPDDTEAISGQNYRVDNASTDLIPTLTTNVSVKLNTGKTITFPAGTRLAGLSGVDLDAFINDPANKGKWNWQANYNMSALDENTGVTYSVYEDMDDNPSFSNRFSAPSGYKSYWDYQKEREDEMNKSWKTGKYSGSGGGSGGGSSAPSFPDWKKSNPAGTWAQYKKQFP